MTLAEDRFFGPDPEQKAIARSLYTAVASLPLICPHGHVDPRVFSDPAYSFGTPADMIIVPDHYVFRMLYSQGISLESLGIPTLDGTAVESDHRRIWQLFAENYFLFRGTPTGIWLDYEFEKVFGITEKLTGASAQRTYDVIAECLTRPEFRPRALYEQFNIEVLCTTDAATDTLEHHQAIRASGWHGRILPTFRPDGVVNLNAPGWRENIDRLSEVSGIDIHNLATFIQALEQRRTFFKSMGATATDHATMAVYLVGWNAKHADEAFRQALKGKTHYSGTALKFTSYMLEEMARMSIDDGMVMQLHVGAYRNHNRHILNRFGRDKGADIPMRANYTEGLSILLNRSGNDPRLTLVLFTLDETTYARELAPLAGHYPAVVLGPPWWFHDSLNGMQRFFDQVMETAGIYNTAGFNDDTRAFPSIPARHDVWRRAACNWLARLVITGIIDMEDAAAMAHELAYGLAKRTYRL